MFIEYLNTDPTYFFRIVTIVIFSIVLHELGHGMAAIWQGDSTPEDLGHMTLNPIKHMGFTSLIFLALAGIAWGQMPVNPANFRSKKWGDFFVSMAGPLVNLCLAIIAILLIKALTYASMEEQIDLSAFEMVAVFNLVLMFFNLLPVPPLDGFQAIASFSDTFKKIGESSFSLILFIVLFTSGITGQIFQWARLIVNYALQ